MNRFSISTLNYLSKSGWYPNRDISVRHLKEAIIESECFWFEKVENFLKEFGGLTIHFKRDKDFIDYFHFNILKTIKDVDLTWLTDDYSLRIGYKLCVIGQAYSNHLVLCMDDEGKVYGGYDDLFYLIGNTGDEAIENLCVNKQIIEIQ